LIHRRFVVGINRHKGDGRMLLLIGNVLISVHGTIVVPGCDVTGQCAMRYEL